MKKIIALDLGDAWVGIAISDFLKITAKPLQAVATAAITAALSKILEQEPINTIVVGLPLTLSGGTDSDQTKRVRQQATDLEATIRQQGFADLKWVFWDERLSSKRAAALKFGKKTKEEKLMEHAKAAAFILQNYLDFLSLSNPQAE